MMKLVISLLIFIFINTGYADVLYIKSKNAKLREHPQKKHNSIKVKHSTKLTKIKKVHRWLFVKYKEKKLWVYQGKVSKKIPQKDRSLRVIRHDDIAVHAPGDHLTRKFSSFNGIEKKHMRFMNYHKSCITTDKKGLFPELISEDGIETIVITSELLEKFQEEGEIGEYADIKNGFE
ncbi:hypothetical protein [Candidatus Uabimicrobium sp. HlEnr_7]|uniref:hypothetical protein n=1 Tax=Candidatus Uabimicrobium helgolandensis TaxID=3095367 RepID=UPI00355719A7